MSAKFKIGDRVRSVKVGRKDAFNGTIIAEFVGAYNVRSDDGRKWYRADSELTRLPDEAASAIEAARAQVQP